MMEIAFKVYLVVMNTYLILGFILGVIAHTISFEGTKNHYRRVCRNAGLDIPFVVYLVYSVLTTTMAWLPLTVRYFIKAKKGGCRYE